MLGLLKRKSPKSVTKMTAAHYSQCADIHAKSFSIGWSDGALHELLGTRGMHGLVATAQNGGREIVCAFLIYRIVAGECEIITVATAPESRRSGAARRLLEDMIRHCLTDRLEEIFLEVDETNQAAIKLYRSLGFREVGKRKAYYRVGGTNREATENSPQTLANETPPAHDAAIMRLDLRD